MLVAVQGCSHGSLSQIYDTITTYATVKNRPVDLLLLCGDFQALRSEFDFGSLAVPQKYHSLGTFHQYYSGEKVAPVLTIVIGGNHEASNYMWELYHGGWLAPNIYYLGAAGSVYVDGLRIVGASGIYKNHDYTKGHFEKVPYDKSTLRSVYHIRQYDIAKLMQLRPTENTIMLSHDWPISIARHGDTAALLRRKPFFRDEINSNTLGSPPLYTLLNHLQPAHWFAAHLHVKFAAIFKHEHPAENANSSVGRKGESSSSTLTSARENGKAENPDEIAIDDLELELENDLELALEKELGKANPDEIVLEDFDAFDDEPSPPSKSLQTTTAVNPEEIIIDDDEFDDPAPAPVAASALASTSLNATEAEAGPSKRRTSIEKELQVDESVDLVEAVREAESGAGVAHEVVAAPGEDAAKALKARDVGVGKEDKGRAGRSTKFLALDKCGPGKDFIQFLDIPSGPPSSSSPRLTYDKEWLAISRAFHPFLSTQVHQPTLPAPHILRALVDDEISRIAEDGLLVPSLPTDGEEGGEEVKLDWEKGDIEIGRVQRFWPTAPAHGQPGGNPNAWYTNPQTEAFCGMLGVENKVNPAPRQ